MDNSNLTLEYFRRQAKKIRKERGISHTEALELIAKENGFFNWKNCVRCLTTQSVAVNTVPKIKAPESKSQLSFTDWLRKHKNRDSPLGDLATDAMRDKTWPSHNSLGQYRYYLFLRNASWGATEALERAWKSYRAYLRRKNLSIPENIRVREEVIVKDKQQYLDKNYPFGVLKLSEKKRCIHCGNVITVGDYKVYNIEGEEFICCPNAPECDGTIIDWLD